MRGRGLVDSIVRFHQLARAHYDMKLKKKKERDVGSLVRAQEESREVHGAAFRGVLTYGVTLPPNALQNTTRLDRMRATIFIDMLFFVFRVPRAK